LADPSGARLGSLSAGDVLGPYRVLERLGEGGMGEVYRATDTRLDRMVAIKVLRAELRADPEALARLGREAKAVSALNHPGIVALYDVGSERGIDFLVMEYVKGKTLAEQIRAGAIRLTAALELGVAIADALAAAHAAGLIHRDLKPSNVMILPDGRAKVLDFGIVRLVLGPDGATLGLTRNAGTAEAMLGTVGYMSPEQANGDPVDARADVFAFGALLYEMISGEPAFRGSSPIQILTAILTKEPAPLRARDGTVSPEVQRIVSRCLRKDPRRRFQSMADVRASLEDAVSEPSAGVEAARNEAGPSSARSARWQRAALAAVTAALVLTGGALALNGRSASEGPLPTGPVVQLTRDMGLTWSPSLSDDGRMVAYASDRAGPDLDIWVQQTTGGPPVQITEEPGDDHEPDISPDGSLVAFRSERQPAGVYVVSALGGEDARPVAPEGRGPKFSPDGRSLAYWTGPWLGLRAGNSQSSRETYVVSVNGGEARRIATSARDPVWSPDGKAVLVISQEPLGDGSLDVDWWWVPIDGGPSVRTGAYERLADAGIDTSLGLDLPFPGDWTPSGVFFTARRTGGTTANVWMLPIDQRTGRVEGAPRPVTGGLGDDAGPSVASGGRLAFAGLTNHFAVIALPLEADEGRATGPLTTLHIDYANSPRTAPSLDARYAVRPVETEAGADMRLLDLRTSRERSLKVEPGGRNPTISRSGRMIAYMVLAEGNTGNFGSVFTLPSQGGVPKQICDGCSAHGWLADEERLVVAMDRDTVRVVHTGSLATEDVLILGSPGGRYLVSPDERWVLFQSDGLRLAPFRPGRPPGSDEWIDLGIRDDGPGERYAGWSPDGTLAYMLLEGDGYRCLYAQRIDSLTGQPVGDYFSVHHFHEARLRWGTTAIGSAVVEGLFVGDMTEVSGNLWMTTIVE
jgi:hypothetical protein